MARDGIEIKLEELSEALVFTEVDDQDALAGLHAQFLEVISLTDDGDEKILVDVLEANAKLLKAILDGESDDPDDSLELIGRTLPALLSVFRDGRPVNEVQFPVDLFSAWAENGGPEAPQPSLGVPSAVDAAILAEFLARQQGVTHDMETHILHLEESGDEEHLHALRRLIHTIKGESGMLGLYEVEHLCHAVEDNLEEHPIGELIDPLLALKDWLCAAFAAYARGETPETDPKSIIEAFEVSGEAGDAVDVPKDDDAAHLAKELGAITRGVAEVNIDDAEGLEALQDTLERFGTWLAERGQPYAKDLAMASATTLSDIIQRDLTAPETAFSKVREAVDVLVSLLGEEPGEEARQKKQREAKEAKARRVAEVHPMLDHFEQHVESLKEGITAEGVGEVKGLIRSLRGVAGDLENKDMEALCQAADGALMKWPASQHLDTLEDMGKWVRSLIRFIAGEGAPPGPPMSLWSRFQAGQADGSSEEEGDREGDEAVEAAAVAKASFAKEMQPRLETFESLVATLSEQVTAKPLGELKALIRTIHEAVVEFGQKDMEALCQAASQALIDRPVSEILDTLADMGKWLGQCVKWQAGQGAPPPPPMALWGRFRSSQTAARVEEAKSAGDGEDASGQIQSQELDEKNREHVIQFVGEALDLVETASIHLLTLATEPDNDEAIQGMYRSYHTIKGMSGFVKLQDIRRLSGELEQVLDKVRNGALVADSLLLDVVYETSEALEDLLESAQIAAMKGEPLAFNPLLPSLVALIRGIDGEDLSEEEQSSAAETMDKKLGEFLVESGAATREGIQSALDSQDLPSGGARLGDFLIAAGSVTPEQVAEALRVQEEDAGGRRLGDILVDTKAITSDQLEHALAKQQGQLASPKLGELLVRSGAKSDKDVSRALKKERKHRRHAVEVRETVKVDSDRLNGLVDMIGELVIAQAMVNVSANERDNVSADMMRHLGHLDKITRDLQEMGTSLRLVSVRPTFQKMARLVRDLAKRSGKQVRFRMSGEGTELDKSLVDLIGDPLVHMIRNAVDHGLESDPEERLACGKPPMGHVELRAYHRGGSVFIEVADDGRGLDRDAILAKARERNLISNGDVLADEDIYNLIFAPGFSTAKSITDISGRGVGMDVVRRNIEELRGRVEIQSTPKKGTVFRIHLPLTLAIIDGMIVRCGEQRFVIPTLSIRRLLNSEDKDVSTVFASERMLKVEDRMVPLFRLSELFNIENTGDSGSEEVVVVLEHEEKLIALAVNEILGQQQTVIKPLGETFGQQSGLAGGAVLSDGCVGLILDIGGLVKLSKSHVAQDVA